MYACSFTETLLLQSKEELFDKSSFQPLEVKKE